MLTSGIHLEIWICFKRIDSYSFGYKKLSTWVVLPLRFFWRKRWYNSNSWVKDKILHMIGHASEGRLNAVLNELESGEPHNAGLFLFVCLFSWTMSSEEENIKLGKQVWKVEYSFLLRTSVVQIERKSGIQICFLGI